MLVSIKDMLDTGEVVAVPNIRRVQKEVLPRNWNGGPYCLRENSFVVRQEVAPVNFVRIDPAISRV